MLGLGLPDQKLPRPSIRARDDSPDSVIISSTRESSNFSSLFSSTSGSVVDRCSFGSDVHDPDSLLSEFSKHWLGRDLHRESSCGPDLSSLPKGSNPIKNRYKSTEEEEEDEEEDDNDLKEVENPSNNSFSQALKECQNRRSRSEALPKKHERRRPVSVDLNGRGIDAVASSPRFAAGAVATMKKAPVSSSTRRSGTFPSPCTPNYRGNVSGTGFQKGWSSERVPLPTNCSRRYANAIPLPFNNGRSLPSKWEDAEKWIFSPGDGANRPALVPPPHRRPKSKSGPLGTPGMACYASPASMMVPVLDGGRVGNFVGSSPFSAGVLGSDALSGRGCCGSGGGGIYAAHIDPCIARSASVHGWSDLLMDSSLPSSQDEKLDGTKDAGTMISPVVSRRDMATQMSPESSTHSSPKERPSFSQSPTSMLPIKEQEPQSHHSPKLEIRDVQVDDRVTVTRWSKKDGIRGFAKGAVNIGEWKKKSVEAQSSAWDVAETEKCLLKLKRKEAKITAWENLQKAKAEAEIRKLEMKLEKIRTSSMDKIMSKLRSAQKKAQGMRSSVSASQAHEVARATEKVSSFRRAGQMGSLSGCFTCHAF